MTVHLDPYRAFLEAKIRMAPAVGFEIGDDEINPILLPHQREIVRWAVRGGRRAIFCAFGLGKTFMQIEATRIVLDRILQESGRKGRALIVLPLGVRQEFRRDAHVLATGEHERITDAQRAELRAWQEGHPDRAPSVRFIRRSEEIDGPGIYLTNYESVRDGKLDPALFDVASLDEASVLRSYGSKTFQTFLALFACVRFRFVATATPSPNRTKELIHYAGFLGVMDTGQALTRFFQRDSSEAGNLTLYPHKEREFWLWINSWACFVQKPSDLCDCSCHRGKTSFSAALASSKSSSGCPGHAETVLGDASATAAVSASRPPITCSPVETSVVAASGHSMASRAQAPIALGAACSTGSTEISGTTAIAASSSANAGELFSPSSKTWDSPQPVELSSVSTTTGAMSPETADGLAEKSRLGTLVEPSSSSSTAADSPLQHGPKSSALATGSSTADTSSAGHRSECSATDCQRCRALDEGYALPPLNVHWHEVETNLADAGCERDGQGILFRDGARGLMQEAKERRDTLPARIARLVEIVKAAPCDHFILWHDLEDERREIEKALPSARSVYGSQDLDLREQTIVDFSDGKFRLLAAKPVIAGSGCNFQRHCHRAVFVGVTTDVRIGRARA